MVRYPIPAKRQVFRVLRAAVERESRGQDCRCPAPVDHVRVIVPGIYNFEIRQLRFAMPDKQAVRYYLNKHSRGASPRNAWLVNVLNVEFCPYAL